MTTTPESKYKPVGFLQGRAYYEFHQTRPHGQPEVSVYDAAALAQRDAEIAKLRAELDDALKNNLHEYLVSEKRAERAEAELSAAKELLLAAKSWINPYRVPLEDEADAKRINERIDAFLQEKPGAA